MLTIAYYSLKHFSVFGAGRMAVPTRDASIPPFPGRDDDGSSPLSDDEQPDSTSEVSEGTGDKDGDENDFEDSVADAASSRKNEFIDKIMSSLCVAMDSKIALLRQTHDQVLRDRVPTDEMKSLSLKPNALYKSPPAKKKKKSSAPGSLRQSANRLAGNLFGSAPRRALSQQPALEPRVQSGLLAPAQSAAPVTLSAPRVLSRARGVQSPSSSMPGIDSEVQLPLARASRASVEVRPNSAVPAPPLPPAAIAPPTLAPPPPPASPRAYAHEGRSASGFGELSRKKAKGSNESYDKTKSTTALSSPLSSASPPDVSGTRRQRRISTDEVRSGVHDAQRAPGASLPLYGSQQGYDEVPELGQAQDKEVRRESLQEEDDQDGRRKKVKRAALGMASGQGSRGSPGGKKFACPYFKRNSRKYSKWTSCPGPGWDEVHRVK